MALTRFTALVLENKEIATHIRWFRFSLGYPSEISFTAGQYATYIINDSTRRTYSFCSPPIQNTETEICVDTMPQGKGSKWLEALKINDQINFLAPLGHFTVNKDSNKNKIFIATSTGISPIRSMISECIMYNVQFTITLIFGVRSEDRAVFFDEFTELAKKYANFSFYPILSQPKGQWQGRVGHVNDVLDEIKKNNSEFYICGNKKMIEGVKDQLIARGVNEEDICHEQFF